MSVDDFVNKYNGVHVDEDGYYGAQCWDLVARYAREVVGCPSFPTGSGGAEGLYRLFQAPIPQYFDRIANDPNDPNQLPQKGDVIVWGATFSPPWGHTALCISANSAGTTNLEQNGNNPGGVAYIKTRGWTGVSGWLRPKQGANIMKIAGNFTYDQLNRLHRQMVGNWDMPKSYWDNIQKYEFSAVVLDLSNNSNADTAMQWQTVGENAVRDRWDKQIYSLQDALKVSNQALADANAALTAARQQLQDLGSRPTKADLDAVTAKLQDAEKTAMDAQANYEKAHADLAAVQQQQAADQETGNAFLRWIGKLFNSSK